MKGDILTRSFCTIQHTNKCHFFFVQVIFIDEVLKLFSRRPIGKSKIQSRQISAQLAILVFLYGALNTNVNILKWFLGLRFRLWFRRPDLLPKRELRDK